MSDLNNGNERPEDLTGRRFTKHGQTRAFDEELTELINARENGFEDAAAAAAAAEAVAEAAGKGSSKTKAAGQEMSRAERRRAAKRRNTIRYIVVLLVLIAILLGVIFGCSRVTKDKNPLAKNFIDDQQTVSVLCTGDLVMHLNVLNAANTAGDGTGRSGGEFIFTGFFRYMKDIITDADYAFVSLEAPLVESDYSGYPIFRSPDQLATDLAEIGYDTVLWCGNHVNDAGENGALRTVRVVQDAGMSITGTRAEQDDPRYLLTDVKGVQVAIVAYTYSDQDTTPRNLNGNIMTETLAPLVNTFTYASFDDDLVQIKETVAAAREAGADYIIMYYHWGDEYSLHSTADQQDIAEKTAKQCDVDIIVGSHPHVPEEMEIIDRSGAEGYTGASKVPVYYSMGNLLSNQRRELMDGNRCTEEGYMIRLNLIYSKSQDKVIGVKRTTIPYWEDMYGDVGDSEKYTLVPLIKDFKNNEFLNKSGHVEEAKQAKKDIKNIIKNGSI